MTVAINWSLTPAGAAITDFEFPTISNGDTSSHQQIYLSHDGASSITGCGFYFREVVGGYTGDDSPAEDFAEIKSWGDYSDDANGFGGAQIEMDPVGAAWGLTHLVKSTATAFVLRSGVGDTPDNAVTLVTEMSPSMVTDGVIPTGVEVSFLIRFQVPTNEDVAGVRQIQQVFKYTFTS